MLTISFHSPNCGEVLVATLDDNDSVKAISFAKEYLLDLAESDVILGHRKDPNTGVITVAPVGDGKMDLTFRIEIVETTLH